MSEIKLPLPRWEVSAQGSTEAWVDCTQCDAGRHVLATDVHALERAFVELQARHAKLSAVHDETEGWRSEAIAAQVDAERERDEARAELTRRAENWETNYARQLQKTLAFLEDLERVTKERDEARAALASAQIGWVQCTTANNACLGGCRTLAEHDLYRHAQLRAWRHEVCTGFGFADDEPASIVVSAVSGARRDLEEDVQELGAEVDRLKRIEAAAKAWIDHCAQVPGAAWIAAIAANIVTGIGPDGEAMP